MSRFFATGSDSDSDTSSENVPIIKQQTQMVYYSDSDDNKKRVIRSAYEKKRHEITVLIDKLKNLRKIKDFTNMVSTFEDMTRIYQKSITVLMKTDAKQMPRFYVRCLVELEDFVQEVWEDKDYRKTLYKNNSKSLATLRQKLRKYNKEHEHELASYRANPVLSDVSDEESDESDDDKSSDYDDEKAIMKSIANAKKTTLTGKSNVASVSTLTAASVDAKKAIPAVPLESVGGGGGGIGVGSGDMESDRESNDSFWQQDSDTDSSSSDNAQYTTMRERFLKKSTVIEKEEDEGVAAAAAAKKKERKEKEKLRRAAKEQAVEEDEGGEWEMVKGGPNASTEKFKMFAKDEEITPLAVVKKLNEIISYRGKKKSSRREILTMIGELHAIAEAAKMNVAILLKIRYSLIIAIYDYNFKVSDAMKPENWEQLLLQLEALMDMLLKQPQSIRFSMMVEQPENLLDAVTLPFVIRGSVLLVVEKMDEEFTKLIKDCDCHSNEYVERLKNEPRVVAILTKMKRFLEVTEAPADELCAIYLRVVEHLYYKVDSEYMKRKLQSGEQHDTSTKGSTLDEINKLCTYIYANDSTDRLRTRAIMCHIYHHALHKNWYKARDLFLMSHLQETISFSDPSTQILYNRMIANLGLCAFRHGNIRDAHNCLVDLMVSGRQKELLAQGMVSQKQIERSKEQEKIEKLRQIPFHMHINMEMLECVYLISAMLIEIPYMAAHEFDARRKMISKTFYQLLRNSERQNLLGPPETMREHIVAATKAMRSGQWQQCVRYLIDDKMNKKIWDLFHDAEEIRKMLSRIVREEALRTYLFTYSKVYDSISMEFLGEMFELDRSVVHSTISKMIINEELMASLDEPTQSVVMHRTEPSRLQSLALQLADKATNFLDTKERILEAKQIAMMPNSRLQMYRNNDRQNYRNTNQSTEMSSSLSSRPRKWTKI